MTELILSGYNRDVTRRRNVKSGSNGRSSALPRKLHLRILVSVRVETRPENVTSLDGDRQERPPTALTGYSVNRENALPKQLLTFPNELH